MKQKAVITSLVLTGSLAVGGGLAFSQSGSESKPGGSIPGSSRPSDPSTGVNRTPGGSDIGKEQGRSGLKFSTEEIKQVQQALKEKGHDPGSATGVMNEETRQAIRAFQKANNLTATGTLDQETAQKLGVSVSGSAGTGSSSGSGTQSPYTPGSSPGIGSGSTGSGSSGRSGSSESGSGAESGASGSSRGSGSTGSGSSLGSGSSGSGSGLGSGSKGSGSSLGAGSTGSGTSTGSGSTKSDSTK
jgi:peptidoglycan hydrolase-like protein with peptidoglycan-binding domain